VTWYLPTAEDYILARKHGLRRILPDLALNHLWNASVRADNTIYAWKFNGYHGYVYDNYGRYNYDWVRCVAR
jgi:hypothetical protein